MKLISKMSLTAIAFLAFAGTANAAEHISATGSFDTGTATTAYSSAHSTFNFEFDVLTPVSGPYDAENAIYNAHYSLNGAALSAPISAIFYNTAEDGMFDILFSDGTRIGFYGDVLVDAAGQFIKNGFYTGAATVNDALASGAGGVALEISTATDLPSPAPEPATWGMMILGFGIAGAALRRSYRRSEDNFTLKVRRLANA